ncbi:sigma factor-like helix-turn-helix DNA-binding protein [Mesorhizobium sp. M0276]|uniref:sigma factor-like helix-turn-helix DNA-binding protein n=1 Tax=Mesorhizobium sp. M0276 TaxID=2956928 RepID=UPI0033384A51
MPPKERACVLLKDVFDYSLEETAELVDSVGGVKSALSRGRAKLADLPAEPAGEPIRPLDPDTARLLKRYVDLFNRHDWDGVRSLTSADARLRVAVFGRAEALVQMLAIPLICLTTCGTPRSRATAR